MESTPAAEELDAIEALPIDERAAALEMLEERLRSSLDEAAGA